jgi:NAD(P)-dependent dehydrogenase (short-subunit alcohol dehydrogenase family)
MVCAAAADCQRRLRARHARRRQRNRASAAVRFDRFTQSLAREFRVHNIAINAVCPGAVENRMDEAGRPSGPSLAEKLAGDVARTVLFLASTTRPPSPAPGWRSTAARTSIQS